MPELPEVEIARRNLRKWLRGQTIRAATISASRVARGQGGKAIERFLVGKTVENVERRGKWLRIAVDGGFLHSHLGMTGKWVRRPVGEPAIRFERARFDLDGGSVRYTDPRLFGRLLVGDNPAWEELGPDPLEDGIDAAALREKLQRRSGSIKEVLLDQSVLAGVGNIQAQEALWRAKIDPRRAAKSLSATETRALGRAIADSIEFTLAEISSPEIEYVEEGGDNPFKVYAKAGEPCPRCGTILKRIVQGGRSTVFCRRCQPAKRS